MKNILITIIGIAFFVFAGSVCTCERDGIGLAQCVIQSAISLCVMIPCVYALNCLED